MSTHVALEVLDGRTVACKRATGVEGVGRIRAEAVRLAALAGQPGVVRMVEWHDDPDEPLLVTEYVGSRSLETAGTLPAERAARLVAHLAGTVAGLHAVGTVHGAVRPEHVLVAGDATVLCSPASNPDAHHPADDVAGVGTCLRAVVATDLEAEPIPERWRFRPPRWHGYRQRALLTLADVATADDPSHRPSARALADAIAAVGGPVPRSPGGGDPTPPVPPTPWRAVLDRIALTLDPPRRRRGTRGRPAGLAIPDVLAEPPPPAVAPIPLVVTLGPEPGPATPARLVVDLAEPPSRPP